MSSIILSFFPNSLMYPLKIRNDGTAMIVPSVHCSLHKFNRFSSYTSPTYLIVDCRGLYLDPKKREIAAKGIWSYWVYLGHNTYTFLFFSLFLTRFTFRHMLQLSESQLLLDGLLVASSTTVVCKVMRYKTPCSSHCNVSDLVQLSTLAELVIFVTGVVPAWLS